MAASYGKLGPLKRRAKREKWDRWIVRDVDEMAMLDGYVIDLTRPKRVRRFFKQFLRHSKGTEFAGKPFELMRWQYNEVIVPTFGWVHQETRLRRIRVVYVEIPKKNGKSTLGAGIGLYLLLADGEPGAEIYSAATKREQAGIIHDEAVRMVKRSPALYSRLRINEATKMLTFAKTSSVYKTLAKDSTGAEGINIHGLICDEMHVWKDRAFYESLRYGGAARTQPLTFIVTTAGEDDQNSIGYGEHDRAEKFLKGDHIDPRYHAVVYKADEKLDPLKASTHKLANPSYGKIIDPKEMMEQAHAAKDSPTTMISFRRYRLDQWVGQAKPWIDTGTWDCCADPMPEEHLRGRKCYGGIDVSTKLDLCACAWAFEPVPSDPFIRLLVRIWCPGEQATIRANRDRVKYLVWAQSGDLRLFDTDVIDFAAVAEAIRLDRDKFNVQREGIGIDPWNSEMLRQELDANADYIVEFPQIHKHMTGPTKELEALARTSGIRHDGNECLRWAVGNVRLIEDTNGNVRPSKKKSVEKIDPAVACIMAIGRLLRADSDQSVYEKRGAVILGA